MRFNWKNSRLIIGYWPVLSGGEFIIRCLGMSKWMIPIASSTHVFEMMLQSWAALDAKDSHQRRYDIIVSYAPTGKANNGDDWHKNFLNSANWLDTDTTYLKETSGRKEYGLTSWFSTPLWTDAHLASQEYFDRFWRDPSCAVSKSNMGFVVKTHAPSEVAGLHHLIPQSKIFSCSDYHDWQSWCLDNKILKNNASAWQPLQYQRLTQDSFIFSIDDLMWSDESFLIQMKSAFQFFDLDDFRKVKDHLVSLKSEYIRWNKNFASL